MQEIEISFDRSRIDFQATSNQLKASYWGGERTDLVHERAFENSLCVAAFIGGEQVGFGRAITDYAVMAYIADVIVWPEHRGKGIGKLLVQAILDHPDLSPVVHFSLTTVDAHSFYAAFGFKAEGRYMRLDRF